MAGCGSPCGACKFLRRKCVSGCVFAPHFCHEKGAAHFAAIHKVFGASNASKLLMHLPPADRSEAVVTISYEAQARILDPVYGCVAHIFALQRQPKLDWHLEMARRSKVRMLLVPMASLDVQAGPWRSSSSSYTDVEGLLSVAFAYPGHS
ncbi:hypothetical protein BHE74_00036563 [Ensete ventricosum]|nr:hypothetical protein BHE74_00036563 [Ensete ventricosum]